MNEQINNCPNINNEKKREEWSSNTKYDDIKTISELIKAKFSILDCFPNLDIGGVRFQNHNMSFKLGYTTYLAFIAGAITLESNDTISKLLEPIRKNINQLNNNSSTFNKYEIKLALSSLLKDGRLNFERRKFIMDKLLDKSKLKFETKNEKIQKSEFIRGIISSKKDLIELFDLNGSEYFGGYVASVLRNGIPREEVTYSEFEKFINDIITENSEKYNNLKKFLENHERIKAEQVPERLKQLSEYFANIKNIIDGKSEEHNIVEDKKQFESFLIYFGDETINPNLHEEIGYFRFFSKAICITKKNGECVLDDETETRFYEQLYNDAFDQVYYKNENKINIGGSRKRNNRRNSRKRNSRRRNSRRRNSRRRISKRRISRRSRRISRRRNNRSIKKRNN